MRRRWRWLLLGALAGFTAACPPDLSVGRAYRCTPGGASAQCRPWACRLDGFCHDPAVGEPLACASEDDCGGGWFCGKDGRCHDPALPAALPCDDDAQCAGGWRCSTEDACVDPGPPPGGASGRVEALLFTSPTLAGMEHVAFGPTVFPGTQEVVSSVAFASGPRVDILLINASTSSSAIAHGAHYERLELNGAVADVALSLPFLAVTLKDGGTSIRREAPDAGTISVFDSATPFRFWPLPVRAPDDGLRPFAVATGDEVRLVCEASCAAGGDLLWSGGSRQRLVDVASTGLQAGAASSLDIPLAVLTLTSITTLSPRYPAVADSTPFGTNLARLGTVTAVALRAVPEGFAVAFEILPLGQRAPESYVAVAGWEARGSLPVPEGSTLPDGGVTAIILEPQPACTRDEVLLDFAIIPPEVSGGGPLGLEVVCEDRATKRQRLYGGSPLRPIAEREEGVVDGRTSGAHAYLSRQGHLALGSGVVDPPRFVLSSTPDWMGFLGGALLARTGPWLYEESELGLFLAVAAFSPVAVIERIAESDSPVALFRQGYASRFGADGSADVLFVTPELPTSTQCANAWHFEDAVAGDVLVAALGDAFYTGARDAGLGNLVPVTRPAPGFDVSAAALTRSTDAGVFEAWAVANRRLFRLVARSVDRWSSSELPLTGVEPLAVWYEEDQGRVATSDGVVLALPQRLPMSEALGEGTSTVVGTCGTALALRGGELWQLGAADGGLRPWEPVPSETWRRTEDGGLDSSKARVEEPGRLYLSQGRVLVASVTGVVYEVRLAGCPPR